MSAFISVSEWFSSTNTSTLVTALERVGATAGVGVCAAVFAGVGVCAALFAGVGWARDVAPTWGVPPAVEHPHTPSARMPTRAARRTAL